MEIKILVHGVPTGFDVTEDAQNAYIQNFYNRQKGSNYFVVEIRRNNSQLMSCYTLYISRNVFNSGNRPGSYFAISLLIDDYVYTDFKTLYKSMQSLFSGAFVGKILAKQSDGFRYTIGSFAEEHDYISQKTTNFYNQIENSLKNNLVKIDNSFSLAGSASQHNPDDLSNEELLALLRKNGGIVLSDEIPSAAYRRQLEIERAQHEQEKAVQKAENERLLAQERAQREQEKLEAQQREQRLQEQAKRDSERQLQQKNAEIEAVRNSVSAEIKALKKTIGEKDTVIREYNKEYQKLATLYDGLNSRMAKAEMAVAKMNTDVAQLGMNAKTQPSGNVAGADGSINLGDEAANRPPRHRSGNNPQHLKWILGIFGAIVLVALLFAFFPKSIGSDMQRSDAESLKKELYDSLYNGLHKEIKMLKRELEFDIKVGNNSWDNSNSNGITSETFPEASQKNIFKDNIRIDVTGNHVKIEPNAKAVENGTKDDVAKKIENLLESEVLWIACGNNDTISKYGKECDIVDIATKYKRILVEFKGLRFYRSTANKKPTSCEEIIQ